MPPTSLLLTQKERVIHLLRYFAREYSAQKLKCAIVFPRLVYTGQSEFETSSLRRTMFFLLHDLFGEYVNSAEYVPAELEVLIELYAILYIMGGNDTVELSVTKESIDWNHSEYQVSDQLWNILRRYACMALRIIDPQEECIDEDLVIEQIIQWYSSEVDNAKSR